MPNVKIPPTSTSKRSGSEGKTWISLDQLKIFPKPLAGKSWFWNATSRKRSGRHGGNHNTAR